MKKLVVVLAALLLCVLPVFAQEAAAPVTGDLTSPVTDMGITGLLTLGGTYAVRRLVPEKKLENRPQILGWTSVAMSILGGAITTYATGGGSVKPAEALTTALVGWLTAQGTRRTKKLIGQP